MTPATQARVDAIVERNVSMAERTVWGEGKSRFRRQYDAEERAQRGRYIIARRSTKFAQRYSFGG